MRVNGGNAWCARDIFDPAGLCKIRGCFVRVESGDLQVAFLIHGEIPTAVTAYLLGLVPLGI